VFTTSTPRSTIFTRKMPVSSTALSLAWSLDGTRLAAGSSGSSAIVWAASGRVLYNLPHNGTVNGVAWNPNNANQLATGASDGTLNIWDVSSPTPTKTTYSGFG